MYYHIVLLYHSIAYHVMSCHVISYHIVVRPVHLLRVSLLRVLESNFPGDSLQNYTDMRNPTL